MKHSTEKAAENKFTALKEILQSRIESGRYPSGSRLPSIRSLSQEFNLVIRTVQLALEQLEDEGFIVTIHGKGSYVNEHFQDEKCLARIAFVFPEIAISDEILDLENWTIGAQFSNGLLAGAQKYGAEVVVLHIDRHLNELQQLRWLRKLKKFDAAVFLDYQLASLQKKLALILPVFTPLSLPDSKVPFIKYDDFNHQRSISKLVAHAVECGCRTAGVISLLDNPNRNTYSSSQFFKNRAEWFIQECRNHHLRIPASFCLSFDDKSKVKDSLATAWKDGYPDFLFCNQAYLPKIIYRFCMEKGLRIGMDIKIAAYASGMTFQGLWPDITYIKTSLFQSGMNIVREVCRFTSKKITMNEIDLSVEDFPLLVNDSTYSHTKKTSGFKSTRKFQERKKV